MSAASRAVWWRQTRLFATLSSPSPTLSSSSRRQPTTSLPSLLRFRFRARAPLNRRLQSTKPPNPTSTSTSTAEAQAQAQAAARKTQRADAILQRASRWVPSRLRPYLSRLRSAPFSHVAAFLVLHELTAIVPLFGLVYMFSRMDWVPTGWVLGPWAAWAEEGLKRYVRYFRKKGWFGLGEGEDEGAREGEERLEERLREEVRREKEKESTEGKGGRWLGRWRKREDSVGDALEDEGVGKKATAWQKVRKAVTVDHTEKGYKIGIQIAAAYAITKMLLIPRIALSLWATPWLARGFVAARRSIWRKRP
ncbi:hypothetical protein GGR53DRAFT_87161 [Hypoxylon sp. FL1150]|nr:hypothetical protein GGR53DRAFT_87161 [Hypoxylon sp. FL1150]